MVESRGRILFASIVVGLIIGIVIGMYLTVGNFSYWMYPVFALLGAILLFIFYIILGRDRVAPKILREPRTARKKLPKEEKFDFKNALEILFDFLFSVAVPIVIGCWVLGLFVEVILHLGNYDYAPFLRYGQLSLTLFGFCILGGLFKKNNDEVYGHIYNLATIFLSAGISFLVVHSLSFVIAQGDKIPFPFLVSVIAGVWLACLLIAYGFFVWGLIYFFTTLVKARPKRK